MVTISDGAALNRWRLVLGKQAEGELPLTQARLSRMDDALDFLYGRDNPVVAVVFQATDDTLAESICEVVSVAGRGLLHQGIVEFYLPFPWHHRIEASPSHYHVLVRLVELLCVFEGLLRWTVVSEHLLLLYCLSHCHFFFPFLFLSFSWSSRAFLFAS